MGVTRKYYTEQFKEEAVKLAQSVGLTQASNDLGISLSNLRRWEKNSAPSSSSSIVSEKDKEILRLKKELKYMYEINSVLKKSLGIFAKDPKSSSL